MTTPFAEVHQLAGDGRHNAVIALLVTEQGGIRDTYAADLNHAWYLVGDALYSLERYDRALSAFRAAFRADTSDPMALMALANAASEMKRPRRAARYLRMALVLAPCDPGLQYNLGNALYDVQDYAGAVEAYAKVGGGGDIEGMARRNAQRAARLASGRDHG